MTTETLECRRMAERVARTEADMEAMERRVGALELAQAEIVRSAWRIVFYLLAGAGGVIGGAVSRRLGLL